MNHRLLSLLVLVAGAVACRTETAPQPSSGIEGQVLRGPITPVCSANVPCYLPFAATFYVERSGHAVASFQTDSGGRFLVHLVPGTYAIVPAPGAPIPSPASQVKTVVVGSGAVTTARLTFDTYIR